MLQYVVTQCCKSHAYHPWARSMLFVSVASGFLRERVLPNIPWFWFILWILERKGRLLGPFIAGRCLGIWPARQRKGIKMSLMRVELKNQIILSRPDNIYRLACIRACTKLLHFFTGNLISLTFYESLFQIVKNESGHYGTELFTERAVQVIHTHNKSKPLYLYLAQQAVHSANEREPLQAPARLVKVWRIVFFE